MDTDLSEADASYLGETNGAHSGCSVSSAGDINGDGYDDIIFKCRNFVGGYPGHVFIFAGGSDIVVGLIEEPSLDLPLNHLLKDNYPNPFNPSTQIEFDLRNRTDVTICIYNLLGEHIITLFNGILSAGNHVVEWNGENKYGNKVSSGIYLYNLSTDDFTETKKMVLLK